MEIGKQLGDPDSEVRGLNQLGFMKIMVGTSKRGMALLDETMAAAMGGELKDPWAIGATCCSMLFACERISDLQRAAQWCQVVIDFTERRRYVPLSALCRSVYAGVLISRGDWRRAETELLAALEAYRGFGRPLAPIRSRGSQSSDAPGAARGGRAADLWVGRASGDGRVVISLLLERGETALARTKVEHQLNRMGNDGPFAAPLLPLLVRARLAEGDPDIARVAAEKFRISQDGSVISTS